MLPFWSILFLAPQWLTATCHVLSCPLQLILGDTAVPDQPPEEGTAAADAVVASLARCAALRRISVLIYPDSPLTLEAAAIMLTLPRRCRGLHLAAVSHTQFFLTDSEDLASEA